MTYLSPDYLVDVIYIPKTRRYIMKTEKLSCSRFWIRKDDALEWVLENYYDEIRERVFEQEADSTKP